MKALLAILVIVAGCAAPASRLYPAPRERSLPDAGTPAYSVAQHGQPHTSFTYAKEPDHG